MRIVSLNVQNLRLMPGGALFGARNRDDHEDPALDAADRCLTAQVLGRADADIVALQEVFDQDSLDAFHDRVLTKATAPYPWRLCLPGNDGRGLDVAVMARRPWDKAVSHADLTSADLGVIPPEGMDPAQPVFRRDCLELHFGALTLFVVHFKAPTRDSEKSWAVRRLEAQAVAQLAARAGPLWLVAGDFNEPFGDNRAVAPLEALGDNLMQRLPEADRWTFFHRATRRWDTPDGMIASHALAEKLTDRRPEVLRIGLGLECGPLAVARLPGTGVHRPHASDHAAVVMDLGRI
ncbi:endonuclease/exonuclease/phosphatase family protein [Antarctobacter sp.]|uniref:endonuclease/exonuclease/phosphatase family protein n=1 Tax=Antarctobacter sp. TaxID=1872577 RepID=UPI003A93651B